MVKRSIFGSKSEERGFRSIERTWGEKYRLFPQVSFSQLFDPDKSIQDKSNLFYKTSIDYVFCTNDGAPILAIDFDGLGKGFNRDGQYVQIEETTDPYRKAKFDFKIQYAEKDHFPYYIVTYSEIEEIDHDLDLTVVDGIIGSVLARKDFDECLPALIEEDQAAIENMLPDEQQDYIQNLVISQEVDSDFAHNPIVQKQAEIQYNISKITGSMHVRREGGHYLEEPVFDPDAIGYVYTLFDTRIGEVSEVATMRNIGHSLEHLSLIREIAELLVWSKYFRLLSKNRL